MTDGVGRKLKAYSLAELVAKPKTYCFLRAVYNTVDTVTRIEWHDKYGQIYSGPILKGSPFLQTFRLEGYIAGPGNFKFGAWGHENSATIETYRAYIEVAKVSKLNPPLKQTIWAAVWNGKHALPVRLSVVSYWEGQKVIFYVGALGKLAPSIMMAYKGMSEAVYRRNMVIDWRPLSDNAAYIAVVAKMKAVKAGEFFKFSLPAPDGAKAASGPLVISYIDQKNPTVVNALGYLPK